MGDNPNTFPAKTAWARQFQLSRYKVPIYPILTKMDLMGQLEDGQTLKRTYSSDFSSGKMGGNGSYNTRARTNTEESITVDQKDYVASQFPSWEKLLWHMNNDKKFAEDASARLHLQLDATILDTVRAGANNTMDDGSLSGGTSGNGITPTVGNILEVFATANELLRLGNIVDYPNGVPYTGNVKIDTGRKMKVAILDARSLNIVEQYLAGKGTPLGDNVSNNGYVTRFMGFNVFSSNNLPFQAVLTMTADIGNNETLVIAGVTFTAKSTLGSTAGNFKSTGTLADTLTNLKNALNAPYTTIAEDTTTGYVKLTATEVNTVAKELIFGKPGDSTDAQVNISATATATTLTITIKGVNKVTVTETCANGEWTTAKQTCSNIFAVTKCVDLILKRNPNLEVNPVSGQVAKDFVFWDLHGEKVFHDQAPMIINAKMNVSGATAPTQTF